MKNGKKDGKLLAVIWKRQATSQEMEVMVSSARKNKEMVSSTEAPERMRPMRP